MRISRKAFKRNRGKGKRWKGYLITVATGVIKESQKSRHVRLRGDYHLYDRNVFGR